MGDPAGVGPEILLCVLNDPVIHEQCDLVLFCDWNVLKLCSEQLGHGFPDLKVTTTGDFLEDMSPTEGTVVVDLPRIELSRFEPCKVSAACGQASYDFIQAAIDAAIAGKIDAVTTAPINKEALRAAGIAYPGHTEMFAERAKSKRWCMMQYSNEITCTFVTVHVGYQEVPALLTQERILDTIELTAEALLRIRRQAPKIVVCGLNPHAGEHGLFGHHEEEKYIIPAIEAAVARGINVEGPVPPDTAFLPWKRKETDAYVCMYHDQGHIPVKALAFDHAVNTTLGLDIIRTSVDHGTAFDIAWKARPSESQSLTVPCDAGKVRTTSLFAAISLAMQLVHRSGANPA